MRHPRMSKWVVVATALASIVALAPPAEAQAFQHTAAGSGTNDFGDRITILAGENFFLGGLGIAVVREAGQGGPSSLVFLTCVLFDERVGPGFHFLYSNGITLGGRRYYIGIFDDFGPGRTGPTDDMYLQTEAWPGGPCGVTAVDDYPQGWFPVASGAFTVN